MSIAILPEDVIARIAAGEVVERPASVVKELIENSIDAGATSIHVEVVASGRQLIRISDNGSGIEAKEIELAFKRHATSKLRDSADLEDLLTLGFRGEALASISAVSQTTIVTRHRDEKMGTSLKMNGGMIQHHKAIGAPAGTVITIENLFFNTPARLKFLKSDNTEKRQIKTVLTRYAMAYPNIRFMLKQDEREQFRSSGGGDLSDVIVKVFGLDTVKRMVMVDSEEVAKGGYPKIGVFGYVSEASLNRNDRSRIILFINGRAIQDNALTHAVTQAYHTMMESGRYPIAVLLLTMPTEFVDVNVHPTKAEVRFRDANQVFVAVQRAVRTAVLNFADSVLDTDKWSSSGFSGDYIEYHQQTMPIQSPDYGRFKSYDLDDDDSDLDYIPEGAGSPDQPRTLPVLRVVGQIGAAYIIAEGPAGMYLIDQNAAHERIIYEQIIVDLQNDTLKTISPEDSITITLTPADATLLGDLGGEFAQLGFEIEVFGPNTFIIRVMPQVIASRSLEQSLAQMLSFIRKSGKTLDNVVLSLAAASALKNGQILQTDEMQSIVRQLERCPSPHDSPTGQATMIHMSRDHLAKEFQRS
jgi:DNA mismatch repair protein MutL